jgi:DNA-binding LacI/PurR family transcriptional regulator
MTDQSQSPQGLVKPPTIYDVAAKAGVSKSLVSLVLRGETSVSEARREAVLKAIDELGYRPSRFAQQLASSRSRSIGVVITDYKNLSFLGLLKGLREVFDDAGYQVIVSDLHRSPNFSDNPVDAFVSMKVDGIVMVSEVAGLRVQKVNVPIVTIGMRESLIPGSDMVFNDDFEGSKLAIEHLVSLGHTEIAHLTGVGGVAGNRRKAFLEVMASITKEAMVFGAGEPTTEIGGYMGAMELLKSGKKFTAIFAANDYMAAGAWAALREKKIRVPEDVSIIGYDNSPIASEFMLKLTTIDEQGIPVGRQTASLLLERIGHKGAAKPKKILIKPTLIERTSTAAPKKK